MATLYRCNTPTDWLCPCGKIARALRRDGIAFEAVHARPGSHEGAAHQPYSCSVVTTGAPTRSGSSPTHGENP